MTEALTLPGRPGQGVVADSYWRSLQYFCIYRLVVAAVFLIAFLITGGRANLASQDASLFLWADSFYLVLAFAFLFALQRAAGLFDLQLSLQVASDIVILTILMYASGGASSGVAFMLVVVVAAAGLVGQGRLTLFYAALATLAVLLEQTFRILQFNGSADEYLRTGLTSIGFFATAMIARFLALRVVANENLATRRGIELADQVRINLQVIQDMEDGVLVVDEDGRVCLHNRQAEAMLASEAPAGDQLSDYSPALAEHLRQRHPAGESTDVLALPSGRSLLVRRLPPVRDGNTLVYLQDLGRIQAQAQQIKLAALGRLTANIAHEIRNPLAAISNAGELLADEQRADTRARLVRIIGDNSARLNRLVGDVLELGRRDRAQQETVHLAALVNLFLDEYALHDPDVATRVKASVGHDLNVCFDRTHLHRVLENLLTNALRYASGKAGAVRIEASPAADRVEIDVIDDGPGIAEADRGKVFEPFFTTRGTGTGLGLYIARELCDANGARLELVDSQIGGHFRIVAKGDACQPS
ncbi:MAG TPA: HAMP domain-containing sensor histidine kinase [Rhodocyclaceae bacterium]|nr:HAMP domain-containing sensor histidine kinase [Rhodocyclaceae bacterium]